MPTDEWIVLLVLAVIILLLFCLVIWEPAYWAYRAWRLKRAFYLRDKADREARLAVKRRRSGSRSERRSGKTPHGSEVNRNERSSW
jgi:uncharacterized membrane protein YgcG